MGNSKTSNGGDSHFDEIKQNDSKLYQKYLSDAPSPKKKPKNFRQSINEAITDSFQAKPMVKK